MERDLSKEKKDEIIQLFQNNELNSEEEYEEIKKKLHTACQTGDLELIKILLSESITDESNEMIFKINKETKTASLFNINKENNQIIIPRSIKHGFNDYLVTSISRIGNFNIKSIMFEMNTAVSTIHSDAFQFSEIGEISIPSTVTKIRQKAFSYCKKLTKVIIPTNSSLQTIESDTFRSSNIGEFYVPPTVKKICKSAFDYCQNLSKVLIPTNSLLQTIESGAFWLSCIEEIYFPDSLVELNEGWCSGTNKLTKIVISPSNDQFIFKEDKYLLGKSDSSKDEFDKLLFARRDIKEFYIPSNIKIIASDAFGHCENPTKVEIQADSNLQTIEKFAFESSKIAKIFIPPKVSKICEYAFNNCKSMTEVEFPANSNLQAIESGIFSYTSIKEIRIPSKVAKICERAFSNSTIEVIHIASNAIDFEEKWCFETGKLTKIVISPSNNQFIFKDDKYLLGKTDQRSNEYDVILFASRDIEDALIPSNIKVISSYSFFKCKNLAKVEIEPNSNLQTIGESAFADCRNLTSVKIPKNCNLQTIGKRAFFRINIRDIFIPSKVSMIFSYALCGCKNLTNVEFATNSNLQIIENRAFLCSKIKEISIPSTVTKICEYVFNKCSNLKMIEFAEDSEIKSISPKTFYSCTNLIIMIPQSSKEAILNAFDN